MERKDIVLNNGVTMPPIGYGVFRMTNLDECENAVVQAVKTGYRLIDTAAAYENETAAGKEDLFTNKILCSIAQKHHKSVAQIVLRWLVQREIVPVVKSANPLRMKENLDIFDFVLSEEEMKQIATLDTGHTYATARNTGKAVTEFLEKANQYHV